MFVHHILKRCARFYSRTNALFLLLMIGLAPLSANAQSISDHPNVDSFIAAVGVNDLSMMVLTQTFGDAFTNSIGAFGAPDDSNPMGKMFLIFCSALMAVAFFWFSWSSMTISVGTAESGRFMGNKLSSTWIPIRFGIGMSTLVPLFGGFCAAQLLFMWFAKISTGMTNLMMLGALPVLAPSLSGQSAQYGGSAIALHSDVQASRPYDAVQQLYLSQLCEKAVNTNLNRDDIKQLLNGLDIQGETITHDIVSDGKNNIHVFFHTTSSLANTSSAMGGNMACGGINYNVRASSGGPLSPQSVGEVPHTWLPNGTIDLEQTAFDVQKSVVDQMVSDTGALADQTIAAMRGGASLPNVSEQINKLADSYQTYAQAQYNQKLNGLSDDSLKDAATIMQNDGWMSLGSFYQIVTRNMDVANSIFTANLQVFPINSSALFDPNWVDTAKAQSSVAEVPPNSANEALNRLLGKSYFLTSYSQGLSWLFTSTSQSSGMSSYLRTATVNPIFQLKNIGDHILVVGGSIITVALGAEVVSTVVSMVAPEAKLAKTGAGLVGKLTGWVGKSIGSGEGGDGSFAAFKTLGSYLFIIAFFLMVFGFFLGTYIPMLPFITWYGGLIAWFASTVEGITAAPIGSFIHLDIEGEGLGQRTQHSYLFLFNTLLRPPCMTFGFFAATLGVGIMGNVLLILFVPAMASAQNGNLMTGPFLMAGYLVILTSLMMTTVHGMFNLIHIVPDQVVGWAGGNINTQLGKDTDDRAKSVFMAGIGKGERAGETTRGQSTNQPGRDTANSMGAL